MKNCIVSGVWYFSSLNLLWENIHITRMCEEELALNYEVTGNDDE